MIHAAPQALLIIGCSGFLGREIYRQAAPTGPVIGTVNRSEANASVIRFNLFENDITECVPLSGMHTVVFAAQVACSGNAMHPTSPERLGKSLSALLHAIRDCKLIYVSSDAVFGGAQGPYDERSLPTARTPYGSNLRLCEALVQDCHPNWRIVRMSYLFGFRSEVWDRRLSKTREALLAGKRIEYFFDAFRSPLHVSEAARATMATASLSPSTIVHVSAERLSIWEFHSRAARAMGLASELVIPVPMPAAMEAYLPRDSSLSTVLSAPLGSHSSVDDAIKSDLLGIRQ